MASTNYAKNQQLNHALRSVNYNTMPAYWYIGLSLSTIDETGDGVLEPTDKAYKRVPVVATTAGWTTASSGSLVNKTTITFPQSTQHWGTVKEVFIASHSKLSGSYIWFHEAIDPPLAILDGTKLTIPASAIALDREE